MNSTPAQRINELIRSGAFELDPDETPFLCECAERGCHSVVWLGVQEYDTLRDAGAAITIVGHRCATPEGSLVPLEAATTPDVRERIAS